MRSARWFVVTYCLFIAILSVSYFRLNAAIKAAANVELVRSMESFKYLLEEQFEHLEHSLMAADAYFHALANNRDLNALAFSEQRHFSPLRSIERKSLHSAHSTLAVEPKSHAYFYADAAQEYRLKSGAGLFVQFVPEKQHIWSLIKRSQAHDALPHDLLVVSFDLSELLDLVGKRFPEIDVRIWTSEMQLDQLYDVSPLDGFLEPHKNKGSGEFTFENLRVNFEVSPVNIHLNEQRWSHFSLLALFGFAAFVGLLIIVYVRTLMLQKKAVLKEVANHTKELTAINEQYRLVSETKTQALESQLLAEQRYKSLFLHTKDALFVLNEEGQIQDYNPAFQRMFFKQDVPKVLYLAELMADEDIQVQWRNGLHEKHEHRNWNWLALSSQSGSLWVRQSGHWIIYNQQRVYEGQLSDITSQVLYQEQLKYKAEHDLLTDLWNRTSILNHLTTIAASIAESHYTEQAQVAVIYLNIDRFKLVNDTLGHQMGDKVLCEIAQRLRARFSHVAEIARLGGDEFAIVVPVKQLKHVLMIELESLLIEITRPIKLSYHSFSISASIGVRLFTEGCGLEAERLLHEAGFAMEEAKRRGKNTYAEFNAKMAIDKNRRLDIEKALNSETLNRELSLMYQPIFDQHGKVLVGFEALLRWTSPVLGVVSPAEFIPIAEESGKIIKLGEWVCLEVFAFLADFDDTSLFVSLNVAPLQLEQTQFVKWFVEHMNEFDVSPRQLKIEVTESALMSAETAMTESLELLLEHGIEVYIDDFGTGYSSLARLNGLPATGLKIDKAFVDELDTSQQARKLIKAITAIAENFQLTVTVEGIETASQHEVIKSLYCHQCQGYMFSRPLSASDALAQVNQHSSAVFLVDEAAS